MRRAFETVRFMNVAVMNGEPVQGRPPLSLDTMPAEEAFDTDRADAPRDGRGHVDTLVGDGVCTSRCTPPARRRRAVVRAAASQPGARSATSPTTAVAGCRR